VREGKKLEEGCRKVIIRDGAVSELRVGPSKEELGGGEPFGGSAIVGRRGEYGRGRREERHW